METRIKCPKCNHEFDVTSAISTKVSDELEKKYEKRLSEEMKIIEEERIIGYEHRAPNKKHKSEYYKPYVKNTSEQGCLLFNKIIKTDA